MDWKPVEPTLHRLMGVLAAITNTRWLWLERRERRQLPPENDEYPVQKIAFHDRGIWVAYWAKPRVMDTLDDLRQYDQGGTLGWFFTVGIGVLIGWWI